MKKKFLFIVINQQKNGKLIQLHKQRRIEFAQRHLHLTGEDWKKTIFLDEKVFSTHKDGRVFVWRPKNSRYNEKYILPRSWSGRATKKYFGWASGFGEGFLTPIDRTLNSEGNEMVREWKPTMATNQAQLMNRVEQAWEALRARPNYFKNLSNSVPRRLRQIIENHEASIKY
ncbi:hypothetical protein TKK_0004180 [Trichogramma kaykai]